MVKSPSTSDKCPPAWERHITHEVLRRSFFVHNKMPTDSCDDIPGCIWFCWSHTTPPHRPIICWLYRLAILTFLFRWLVWLYCSGVIHTWFEWYTHILCGLSYPWACHQHPTLALSSHYSCHFATVIPLIPEYPTSIPLLVLGCHYQFTCVWIKSL